LHCTAGAGAEAGTGSGPSDRQRADEGRTSIARMAAMAATLRAMVAEPEAIFQRNVEIDEVLCIRRSTSMLLIGTQQP
jgi:hypothetical protein